MNPELPQAGRNIEMPSYGIGNIEQSPDLNRHNPEMGQHEASPSESSPERQYQGIPAALPVVSPLPVVDPVSQSSDQATNDNPLVAADEDLIEKEWVDKLNKIIVLTKDDPYERSRVITQLQADYLKKRYNKILGKSQDSE